MSQKFMSVYFWKGGKFKAMSGACLCVWSEIWGI